MALIDEVMALSEAIFTEKGEYAEVREHTILICLNFRGIQLRRQVSLEELGHIRPMGAHFLAGIVVPGMRHQLRRAYERQPTAY